MRCTEIYIWPTPWHITKQYITSYSTIVLIVNIFSNFHIINTWSRDFVGTEHTVGQNKENSLIVFEDIQVQFFQFQMCSIPDSPNFYKNCTWMFSKPIKGFFWFRYAVSSFYNYTFSVLCLGQNWLSNKKDIKKRHTSSRTKFVCSVPIKVTWYCHIEICNRTEINYDIKYIL